MRPRVIYETKHYAVIDCKHIAARPFSGENVQGQIFEAWLGLYEELREKGYRVLHRFDHRVSDAVLCEKDQAMDLKHGEKPKAA